MVGGVIPVLGPNLGYPGVVSRAASGDRFIVSKRASTTNALPIYFGDSVVVIPDSTGGTLRSVADFVGQGGTFTAARFAGVCVRNFKTDLNFNAVNGTGAVASYAGSYAAGERAEHMVRGSVNVAVNVGTPVAEGPVYIRTALNGGIPAGVIGGYEAAADGGNSVVLTNVVFKTGRLDVNNTCEITILTRATA